MRIFQAICIFSFAFFLAETLAYVFVYGLVRGKDTYLRRDCINVLNVALLVIELLCLTSLSENSPSIVCLK